MDGRTSEAEQAEDNPRLSVSLLLQEKREIITGIIITTIFGYCLATGNAMNFYRELLLGWLLVPVIILDNKYGLIFDKWNMVIAFAGLLQGNKGLAGTMASALAGAGILFLVRAVSRNGLGCGDIKLMLALSLWLDWEHMLLALLLSFWGGGIYGAWLLLFRSYRLGQTVPFGPFLSAGAWLSFVTGSRLMLIYEGWLYG